MTFGLKTHLQEQKADSDGEVTNTFAERSRNLLFICRQFSAFLLDSDLAQSLVMRVVKENDYVSQRSRPGPEATEGDLKTWHHDCEALDEGLNEILDKFKSNSRYAQMYEQRAKIGIDEVGTIRSSAVTAF